MYNTNKNTAHEHNIAGRSKHIISGVYPYLQMAQVSHGHFFLGGGDEKNTRIRTQLKHILNVITLYMYNSQYLIIHKITNKFPSSVFNHRLNTRYTKDVS